VFYANGIIVGIIMLLFGSALSVYTGYLIAYCAEATGGACYEDIALKLYGKSGLKFTGVCNILCNVGFLISYAVQLKNLVPYTLSGFFDDLPEAIGDNNTGHTVWLTVFCFMILLPMSLPRNLSALRHGSLVSLCVSIFIVITIFVLSFRETKDPCIYGPG